MPMTVSLTPDERKMLQELTMREFPGRDKGMLSTMLGKLIRDAFEQMNRTRSEKEDRQN